MTTNINAIGLQERTQLHDWIDSLSPPQLSQIYMLVKELIEGALLEEEDEVVPDDTDYLLSSNKMRERLLEARNSDQSIPFEVVREKLRI